MHKSNTAVEPSADEARQESWLEKLGPGLITGAADDDPSGIATYSQAGAQFHRAERPRLGNRRAQHRRLPRAARLCR